LATSAWAALFFAWLASRLFVFSAAAAAQLLGLSLTHVAPRFDRHPFHWLATWDGHWYKLIAQHGYLLIPGQFSDPAFFPLLPTILRVLHTIGLSYDLAGLLTANAMFLVALAGVYQLVRLWLPDTDARRTAVIAALIPGSVVMSMIYPESIGLACIAFTGVFAARRRWLLCAACTALATLARPEALLLAIPVAASAAHAWPTLSSKARGAAAAAVLAAPATLATVSIYFWRTLGDPLAWSTAEQAWGRSFQPLGIYRAITGLLPTKNYELWQIRDALFFITYLALLAVAWRARLPKSWILAGAATIILPLTSGSFASDERFGLLAPPIYAAASILTRSHRARVFILPATTLLLIASTITLPYRYP
jgi:hypothetical protein